MRPVRTLASTTSASIRSSFYKPNRMLAPRRQYIATITQATPDLQIIDAVRSYLESDEETRTQTLKLLSVMTSADLRGLFTRVAASSPACLPLLHDVRARTEASGREAWARSVDAAAAEALRPLYGPWATEVGQLSLSPTAPAHVRALVSAAQSSETVHATSDTAAFARKFGQRRMVHSLYHACAPSDLLAVLYSAAVPAIPSSMRDIDQWSGGPPNPVTGCWDLKAELSATGGGNATTVAFYSVGSPNQAMRGLRLGTRIIYSVAGDVVRSSSFIRNVVTLSPIPGFVEALRSGKWPWRKLSSSESDAVCAAKVALLGDDTRRGGKEGGCDSDALATLVSLLDGTAWFSNDSARAALRAPLTRLCFDYMRSVDRTSKGAIKGPACRVASFHLGNGARMFRLLWGADTSQAGLRRSAGLMVNYLYSDTGAEGLNTTMRVRAPAYLEKPGGYLDEPLIVLDQ